MASEQDGLLLGTATDYGSSGGVGMRARSTSNSSRGRARSNSSLTEVQARGYSNSVTGKSPPTLAALGMANDDADSEDTGPTTVYQDITSLLRLAVPFTAGQMVFLIGQVVSTIYLGQISPAALAASGLSAAW